MVNRVDGNNYTNPYAKNLNKPVKSEDAPAFLLDYDEKGVVWDRDEGAKKSDEPQKMEAVTLTLSTDSVQKESDKAKSEEALADNEAKTRVGIWNRVKAFFKRVFDFVWYGDQSKEKEEKSENTIERSTIDYDKVSDADKDKELRALIGKKDTDGVVDILTNHNQHMPARSTGLTTYYNRFGNIVEQDAVTNDRVLHGDKNVRSL